MAGKKESGKQDIPEQSPPAFIDLEFIDLEVDSEALRKLEERIAQAPIDTRAALQRFVPVADQYQRRVMEAIERTVRLVAPAGSGKTQTIINRVIQRVRGGVNPERFLVLTFDNAAMSSLHNTLADQLKGELSLKLQISTLNAFGYRFLHECVRQEHRPIIENGRQRRLLREIRHALQQKSAERAAALPKNVKDRVYLEVFSLLKNALIDPRHIAPQEALRILLDAKAMAPFFPKPADRQLVTLTVQAVLWMFSAYAKALDDDRLMDLDDQKLRAYVALDQDHQLREVIQSRYDEVIVDEFQDLNLLDFVLIKILAERATLIAVGDDDQAIYGFRGSSPDFLIELDERLGRPIATYELSVNYRCPPNIVACADRLIRHNTRRIAKEPVADSKAPSEIKVIHARGAGPEAKSIVGLIKKAHRQARVGHHEMAILYRTNAQSLPLQIELLLSGIPYHVRREDNILANETLQQLLGVLRFKVAVTAKERPTMRDALLTVGAYFRYLTPAQRAEAERALERLDDLTSFYESERFHRSLPKSQNNFVSATHEALEAETLLETLDVLARKFHGLRGMIGSLEDAVDQGVPLGEIYEIATAFKGDMGQFVETIEGALARAKASGAGNAETNGVALRTYFRAKGLQWHTVFLPTCNQGLIPHALAPIEDERRLFYVAMTRASSNLVVSYVNKVVGQKVGVSQFLTEAGLL